MTTACHLPAVGRSSWTLHPDEFQFGGGGGGAFDCCGQARHTAVRGDKRPLLLAGIVMLAPGPAAGEKTQRHQHRQDQERFAINRASLSPRIDYRLVDARDNELSILRQERPPDCRALSAGTGLQGKVKIMEWRRENACTQACDTWHTSACTPVAGEAPH